MSMIAKTSSALFLIFVMLAYCAKPHESSKTMGIDDSIAIKEKAIKLSHDTATALGYKLVDMNSKVSFYDKPWNEFFTKEDNSEYCSDRKKILEGKSYWAVYFYPKQNGKGGDICIFIDVASGQVLTMYRGK